MTEEQTDLGVGHVVIDGIEGKHVRVELPDGSTEDWQLASLPQGVKEGNIIRITVEGGDMDLEIDHKETERRRIGAQEN